MLGRILDAVFPPSCVACGRGAWPFCARCAATLRRLDPPWCARCGLPFTEPRDGCPWCLPADIDRVRAAFAHADAARDAVLGLKFGGRRRIAVALAAPMAAALDAVAADVVTWVPLGRARRRARGFDQARLLARGVATIVGMPAAPLLVRRVETPPQARRDAEARRAALLAAFAARAAVPPRVILVDDVVTTGATAVACARALRAAGARDVTVLAVCRALPDAYTRRGSASGSVVARGIAPR